MVRGLEYVLECRSYLGNTDGKCSRFFNPNPNGMHSPGSLQTLARDWQPTYQDLFLIRIPSEVLTSRLRCSCSDADLLPATANHSTSRSCCKQLMTQWQFLWILQVALYVGRLANAMIRIWPQTTVRVGCCSHTSNRTLSCLLSRSFKGNPASLVPNLISFMWAPEDPDELAAAGIVEDAQESAVVSRAASKHSGWDKVW